jgi:hypothetical protein
MVIFKSLKFWTLVAGLLAFVAKFFFPTFPLDEQDILGLVIILLGLIDIVPSVRARGALSASIVNSLAFWQLVAGLAYFVVKFFAPNLPVDESVLLGLILFILGYFGIHPELRARGLL